MQPLVTLLKSGVLVTACAFLLAACGGGGGSGGGVANSVSSTSSSTYSGPIGGFGSIVVNGVRFSTAGASLVDDDGATVDLSKLRLGMTVRVTGSADDALLSGSAAKLEVVHGTRGVVTAVSVDTGSTTAGTITVLGQIIKVDATTAYQGVAGLSALAELSSPAVEVYGFLRADGSLQATLVEVKTISAFSVTGKVSNLNVAASTFQLGSLKVAYTSGSVAGTLVDGARVKVKAGTGALAGGTLSASSVQVLGAGWAWGLSDGGTVIKVKGVVDAAPVGGVLTLSGTQVDVSKAVIEGSGAIVAGQFVEIKGTWNSANNMLIATKVELEGAREARIGGRNELYGVVSSLAGNTAVVDGVKVDLSSAVFSHGSLAQLSVGSYVEVKGNVVGDTLRATKVELKSGADADGTAYEQFGLVTDFVSLSNFKLNGITVDASKAIVENGSPSAIANGIYLEIKGAQNASGVFVASRIEIKTRK